MIGVGLNKDNKNVSEKIQCKLKITFIVLNLYQILNQQYASLSGRGGCYHRGAPKRHRLPAGKLPGSHI